MTDHSDDPLGDAEMQMAQSELDLFRRLFDKLPRPDLSTGGLADAEAVRGSLRRLADEDPEARELLERLAVFHRFRQGSEGQ